MYAFLCLDGVLEIDAFGIYLRMLHSNNIYLIVFILHIEFSIHALGFCIPTNADTIFSFYHRYFRAHLLSVTVNLLANLKTPVVASYRSCAFAPLYEESIFLVSYQFSYNELKVLIECFKMDIV